MFSCLVDSNLKLELPEPRHAEEAAALVQRNLEHLRPWMPWAVEGYSVSHAADWIKLSLDAFVKDGTIGALIMLDDKIVGSIGFHDLDTANRHASIGYWIDKQHEGKGIVSRCCRVLINYLFDTMELHRLQINCNVENLRSRAIPERLGFRLEGTLREVEFVDGKFRDWAVYGLLRDEWKKK
jgi:ribosomal-protein-serine acetyltransferase